MKYINVQETEVSLAAIVDEITTTQSEIVITRNGLPVARITPCQTTIPVGHYPLRGMPITIADDFDEPMPELWEALGE
ncbi:MAG: type II toxin-antitoxin system Phd/YefM family antitoxin [Xenococcaceae cyanobacterium]